MKMKTFWFQGLALNRQALTNAGGDEFGLRMSLASHVEQFGLISEGQPRIYRSNC
jgi:hypothetical protein